MKEEFTGGEWVADKPSYSNGFWHVNTNINEELTHNVANIWCVDGDDAEANAYLFAQSKNMYRMLEQIADDNRGLDDGFVQQIDDLLAKARGE